jgi:uncharacterized DUF497 family protein
MILCEWDDAKDETNKSKHGIGFATAQLIFDDPYCISFVANVVEGEERWNALGSVEGVIVLVVVHTYREQPPVEIIRIISARRATKHERKLYEQAVIERT